MPPTRISPRASTFANTLANLCEAAGADILDVLTGVGLDHRIGPHFLNPGPVMEAPVSRRTRWR